MLFRSISSLHYGWFYSFSHYGLLSPSTIKMGYHIFVRLYALKTSPVTDWSNEHTSFPLNTILFRRGDWHDNWDLTWLPGKFLNLTIDVTKPLLPHQRINHYLNSYEIGDKELFTRNYNRMRKQMGEEGKLKYNFYPLTLSVPGEAATFVKEWKWRGKHSKEKQIWIAKPVRIYP